MMILTILIIDLIDLNMAKMDNNNFTKDIKPMHPELLMINYSLWKKNKKKEGDRNKNKGNDSKKGKDWREYNNNSKEKRDRNNKEEKDN